MPEPAPIALFVYKRLDTLTRTVEALRRNPEAAASDLIVFSDGPRSDAQREAVQAVRDYLRGLTGFRSLRVVEAPQNQGLANSIIAGVSQVLAESDQVIVMEDDLVVSRHFLAYMNRALEIYRNVPEVISIHGYCYPLRQAVPETFFLRGADCLGWATWRRGWALFDPDAAALHQRLRRSGKLRDFDFDRSFDFSGLLRAQARGSQDSWAIRWYAAAFLAGRLTLYPGRSLVQHIGTAASATNAAGADYFTVPDPAEVQIAVEPLPPVESVVARQAFTDFFRHGIPSPSWRWRLANLLRRGWRRRR